MLPSHTALCQQKAHDAGTGRVAAVLVVSDGGVIGETKVQTIAIGLAILAGVLHVEAKFVRANAFVRIVRPTVTDEARRGVSARLGDGQPVEQPVWFDSHDAVEVTAVCRVRGELGSLRIGAGRTAVNDVLEATRQR
eukprot:5476203-Prymnesium_polylepis.1